MSYEVCRYFMFTGQPVGEHEVVSRPRVSRFVQADVPLILRPPFFHVRSL